MTFFRHLQNRINRLRPPLRTRTWIIIITVLIGAMVFAYGAYVDKQIFQLYKKLEEQEYKTAQAELSDAIKHTHRRLEKQAQELIAWQELRAQFQDPSYYFFWREQSLPTSPFYTASIREVELYGPDRKRLAGTGAALNFLDTIVPPIERQWLTDGKQLYLLRYLPVRDETGHTLGYAGIAFDFLNALHRHTTLKHVKPDEIRIEGNGRFSADAIQTLLKVAPQRDPIAQTLMARFSQALDLLLLLLVSIIGLIWIGQYVLQARGYRQIFQILKQVHQAERPLPLPRHDLPIRELNQLLRLIIRLQHRWLRQRDKSARLLGEVQRIAFQDPLTGLPNRNALIRDLGQHRCRPPFTFVLLDIANFRAFNDTYGSDIGDALLKKIAYTLRKSLADMPDARLYRVGSDEFVLIIPGPANDAVPNRIETLVKQLESLKLKALTGHLSHVKVRAGVVHIKHLVTLNDPAQKEGGQMFSQCMMRADTALLHAKKHQRTVVDCDTLADHQTPLQNHALGQFIDHAVQTGEGLELHAQPIVSPQDGSVLYHELLVRARDNEGNLIHPAELFEWIDRHHLHRYLDHHVIRLAAEYLARGQLPVGQGISINLCEQTLLAADNLLEMLSPLRPFLSKHPVTLEVLESVLMKRLDTVRDQLALVSDHGFQVALDDFGSGYASFRYLAQLPANTVKIDRSLLDMLSSPLERERELFAQLCHMLSEAEFKVVVEGVETVEQCEALRKLPITGLQGFLFSRPQPTPVTHVALPCLPSLP